MRRYRSAAGGWFYWMLHVTAAGCIALAVLMWARLDGTVAAVSWSGVCLAVSAGFYWVLYATWYGLDDRGLTIRSGPYRAFIEYAGIRGVAPTTSMLASPALSLRRLYIDHAGSPLGVRVSPDDPDGFVADLAAHCPHLVRDGYMLAPRIRTRR